MAMPRDIGIIDCMLGIPSSEDRADWYKGFRSLLRDAESQQFKMPAQYMFKDIPEMQGVGDIVSWTVAEMDRFGIRQGLAGFSEDSASTRDAIERFPDRFFFSLPIDPNRGMGEVRRIRRIHKEWGIKALSVFPCGLIPQVPINDKKMYPIYATCVELDLPILVTAGVPGPRMPLEPQKVEHIDEVCWFFPELTFVMRHCGEPWEELAVKLMLKYPNLYYSTSAFAPRHYPKAIIDYANTRGADKVIYAGYFPMGLSLDRIFADMESVPFRDEVWPKFLRDNARRVFKLA